MITKPMYTVKEVARRLKISGRVIRLRCAEGKCPADYYEFPGTKSGYYLLTDKSIEWLENNVRPHRRGDDNDI